MNERTLDQNDDYDYCMLLTRTFLRHIDKPQSADIIKNVDEAISFLARINRKCDFDKNKLIDEISTQVNVFVPGEAAMVRDNDGDRHEEWLHTQKHSIEWKFWRRFEEFQLSKKDYQPDVFRKLDIHTDRILSELENPKRTGRWSRRGLVVGQVQSGKTLNYTALINKAADAGYKLIIVLAGMWEDLRTQTQLRLNSDFLGRQVNKPWKEGDGDTRVGVGTIRSLPHAICGTSTEADFSKKQAESFSLVLGGSEPVLLVVKKNKTVLENVGSWIMRASDVGTGTTGKPSIHDVPLLVIDDEADHASINTSDVPEVDGKVDPNHDPTAINGCIRAILNAFEQNAYVGYTATPFANIFINPAAISKTSQGQTKTAKGRKLRDSAIENVEYGDDLFPRSFILNLPAPTTYVGPAKIFQFGEFSNVTARSPYLKLIDDCKNWMPEKHKRDWIPPFHEFPDSLKTAIKCFMLTCAARMVRGQDGEHNSMLIHVTLLTDVQKRVKEQVELEVANILERLRYGDGNSPFKILVEMKSLWDREFAEKLSPENDAITWEKLELAIPLAVSKIQTKLVNGTAKDALQYEQGVPISVIAVGGNKLSRGMTLYGLSVSYYIRLSKAYDTLMQMGRWFGYRTGYGDLCRLYTTQTLIEWYKHIGEADAELRSELEQMSDDEQSTPMEYGLRVRTHPAGMTITALNKMKAGLSMQVSYSQCFSQTIDFHRDPSIIKSNFEKLEHFLSDCESTCKGDDKKITNRIVWSRVSGSLVSGYIRGQQLYPVGSRVNTDYLSNYIDKLMNENELTEWTVALISGGSAKLPDGSQAIYEICGRTVTLAVREPKELFTNEDRYTIGALASGEDEAIDLGGKRKDLVPEVGKDRGKKLRALRDKTNGLLLIYPFQDSNHKDRIPLIGFATSFPKSLVDKGVQYFVNKVGQQVD